MPKIAPSEGIPTIAADTEHNPLSFSMTEQISKPIDDKYFHLDALTATPISSAVRDNLFHDPFGITSDNTLGGEIF